MSTPTIADFISDRLDGWEQAAREAGGRAWESVGDSTIGNDDGPIADASGAERTHIVLHDPASTLALVAALRAVVGLHTNGLSVILGHPRMFCDVCGVDPPCQTVCSIAAIWADHPEYDGSWAL